MDYEPGSVIIIKNFKHQNIGGDVKDVWMIYLGKDSMFDIPLYLYLHRTTTQLYHYSPGGERSSHITVRFSKGNIFEEDCLLDFNERGYSITWELLNNYDQEEKGRLKEDKIRQIWNNLKKSPHYSKKILQSIRESLNHIGITGLK